MTKDVTPYPVVETGLKRHGHQYSHSNRFRLWIEDTLEPLAEIQAAFFSLLDIDLDTAEGVKLDLIGRLVGAPAVIPNSIPNPYFGFSDQDDAEFFGERSNEALGGFWRGVGQSSYSERILSTEMYRLIIRAQIIKNSSLCTPPDIIGITRMLLDDSIDFAYIEYPMIIVIAPRTQLSRFYIEILRLMIPRPCGVGLAIINGYFDDFGFIDQDYALTFGELDDPSVGGYWTTLKRDLQESIYYGDNSIWL